MRRTGYAIDLYGTHEAVEVYGTYQNTGARRT
jgi:hypothetical protein